MKQQICNPKRMYEIALAYYKQTVWKYVKGLPLKGAQHAVAIRAWDRLDTAHRAWLESLDMSRRVQAGVTRQEINDLRPHRSERDDSIKPEHLATLASARLGIPKPKSIRAAAEDAHRILRSSRDYLKSLPTPKTKTATMLESYFGLVTFEDILDNSKLPDHFPLVPTVQAKRNQGKLTAPALKRAVERHASGAPIKIQRQIREATKNKAISSRLLEEIRWQRFLKHFKG